MRRAHPLRYWDLLRRLVPFGVIELPHRGKGSERMLLRYDPRTGKRRTFPMPCHGEHRELTVRMIHKCLRHLGFDDEEIERFWAD